MNTAIYDRHYSNLEKFSADPINADDERWFRGHWGRKHRMRPPGRIERTAIAETLRPSSRHLSYVLVRQIAPNIRCRTFDWLIDYEPDNEEFCRRAFEDAWAKLSLPYAAPPATSRREWKA